MPVRLGCIADDFTGGTDVAAALRRAGLRTALVFGLPEADAALPDDCDAVVVALKSRSTPVKDAVQESLAAQKWLWSQGAAQVYFKYCSTFDSTAEGNIGPVADALLDAGGSRLTVVCPASPANGRTVYQGHLFVHDRLLAESPMRHHPLTPMTDSDLVRLMSAQSKHPVGLIPLPVVRTGPVTVAEALRAHEDQGVRHVIIDAVVEADLETIGAACLELGVVTGAAGLAEGLGRAYPTTGQNTAEPIPHDGRAAILAGSCSARTLEQIAHFSTRHPALRLDPLAAATGQDVIAAALAWYDAQPADAPALLYASAAPDELARTQAQLGTSEGASLVENLLGTLARHLVERGVRRLIVAGGETSGAVTTALGVRAVLVGTEVDPGVPWTRTTGTDELALMLKSGNFGAPDLFSRALETM
ncbi:3-oxo-tetronate kinase [Streptomyces sp. GbtcB7]|uniref:3-oxo-tetronate kinase n=1 Tax=Streptomyces sp. GbtcB7 TaxID=2824752 RepID=UPI001C2FFEA7|nr:3-oxo-tetronate kinase [Streptomyces sp. GbtcB7]